MSPALRACLALAVAACSSGPSTPPAEPVAEPPAEELPETERTLTIPAEGLSLEGTLHLPARAPGVRVPAVVLVHGSGPQSRDQAVRGQLGMSFGFAVPVFRELAEGLGAAGIAVLRYDKRSCGPFNGCAENGYPTPPADLVIDTFLADAGAALDALKAQPEVDPERLFVLGHSQGASFVPLLAAARTDLAGGLLLAAPHRSIDRAVERQRNFLTRTMADQGVPPPRIAASTRPLNVALTQLAQLRSGDLPEDVPILGAPARFWRSWMDLGPRVIEAVKQTSVPLFFVGGGVDWNVPPEELDAWEATLREAERVHFVHRIDCLTHALTCAAESDPAELGPEDLGRHVHPPLVEALAGFLRGPPPTTPP
ncbi:MAG: alpha/beta hydrolase [Myxococcota bacterium]